MLSELPIWAATLEGVTMRKQMIDDTFVVVIDEIGEVTFQHDILPARVMHISEHETAERAMAAVLELLDLCNQVVGVSAAGFEIMKAIELVSRDFKGHVDRLAEQTDFNRSARQG